MTRDELITISNLIIQVLKDCKTVEEAIEKLKALLLFK